jgi:long-chain acyl-CoA synthetase
VPRLLETLKDKVLRDLDAEGRRERFDRDLAAAEGRHFLRRWWRFRRIHRQFGWKFRAFVCGGAALGRDTETFWKRLGYAVVQGYGLTETASLVSVNHPLRLRKGSIGRIVPGRELKLAADGEILVRGESVAAVYWQQETRAPVAGEDGWFHTGDLGELDPKGNSSSGRKNVIVMPRALTLTTSSRRRQPSPHGAAVDRRATARQPCAVLLREAADPVIVQRASRSSPTSSASAARSSG